MFPIEEILRRSYRLLPIEILALDEGAGCTIDRRCRITGDFDRIGTRAHVRVGIDLPVIANQMFSD